MRKKLLSFCFSLFILTSLHSQNVGIGIIAPLQKLDVNGSIAVNNSTIFLRAGNDSAHGIKYNAAIGGPYLFGVWGGALGTYNYPHALRWDQGGNVGVRGGIIIDTAGRNNGNTFDALSFGGYTGTAIGSKRTTGGNQYGLDFYTGAINRMAITPTGNIGIGTTAPLQKLDVNGNIAVNSNTIFLREGFDANHGLKYISDVDGPYLFGYLGGALGTSGLPHTLTWDAAGNVGIKNNLLVDSSGDNNGTVNSGIRFGGWSGEAIGSKRTAGGNVHGLDFYTNNNNRLAITASGDVGVGTTNPLQKLDISGNASFNDNSIYLRVGSDLNHGLRYKASIDGPYLFGFSGGSLGAPNMPDVLRWDRIGNVTIRNNLAVDTAAVNNGDINSSLRFGGLAGEAIGSKRTPGGNRYGLDWFFTKSTIQYLLGRAKDQL